MAETRVVGIDLGTTNTLVAFADDAGALSILPIAQLVAPGAGEERALFPSCLYAPAPGEDLGDPFGDAPYVAGELARLRGAEVPGRLVASAKSWLCHSAVDRTAPILPWGAGEDADLPRLSPIDASARYLAHVRRVYNARFPDEPLELCDVTLTVPASFDEVARELTLDAATRAGLTVRLLEEPTAAFYDYLQLGRRWAERGRFADNFLYVTRSGGFHAPPGFGSPSVPERVRQHAGRRERTGPGREDQRSLPVGLLRLAGCQELARTREGRCHDATVSACGWWAEGRGLRGRRGYASKDAHHGVGAPKTVKRQLVMSPHATPAHCAAFARASVDKPASRRKAASASPCAMESLSA